MSFPVQTTTRTPDLKEQLTQVGLVALADCSDDFLARASKARFSPRQVVEEIVRLELTEGAKRSLERRLERSRIGRFKPMADFDWNWPKKIERDVIDRALTLDFVEEHRNLVLLGANGVGKTMIARNLAYQAALAGHSVLRPPLRGRPDHLPPQAHQVRLAPDPGHRRGRLPLLRPPRRRPALQGRRPPLREEVHRAHHQPRIP